MRTATNVLKNYLAGVLYSATFDGVAGSYATRAVAGSKLALLGDVTVAAFARIASSPPSQTRATLFRAGETDPDTAYGLAADQSNFALKFIASNGTSITEYATANGTLQGQRIFHGCATRMAGQVQLYINGQPSGAAVSSVTPTNTPANAFIGGISGGTARFKGLVAEIAVYSRALSAKEVALLAAGIVPLVGLVLFIPGWDGTGSTLTDIGNYGSNFAMNGGAGFSSSLYPMPGRYSRMRFVDLYTITTLAGAVSRYTAGDFPITVAGLSYSASSLRFNRGSVTQKVGLEVADLPLDVYAKQTDLLGSQPFIQALAGGALDGAQIQIDRAVLLEASGLVIGTATAFAGLVSNASAARGHARISLKSHVNKLNVMMPRHTFQPGCVHTLYDVGCAADRTKFKVSGAAAGGSTASTINSGHAEATGTYDLGYIQFTSGVLNGQRASVRSYVQGSPSVFVLFQGFAAAPAPGDTFDAFAGCDKKQGTCGAVVAKTFTADPATDVITSTGHGLTNGQAIKVASDGTLPAPLAAATPYFVRDKTTDTFKVAATIGGAAIDITTAGSGTHTIVQQGKFANLEQFLGFPYVPAPETAV